jgi:mannan endo-1,4-beta-mannosidase
MPADPVNPHASPAARRLLAYLYDLPSGHILSGQHNFPATISHYSERVHALTGQHPAVWGQDFGFAADGDKDSIHARDAIISEAIRQHEAGSIITLMWHCVRPTEDEPGVFQGNIIAEISKQAYADLVTPGTAIHRRWLKQVDTVAEHLKRLQAADVPVLWRPYHEMNGNWFWWGKKPGTRFVDMWEQLYQRFTQHHHLNNLLWVWNTNAPNHRNVAAYKTMFPGHATVDILATDVYRDDYQQRFYDGLLKLAQGKPIALGEVGEMPTPEILAKQPEWRWFMTWTDQLETHNSLERVRAIYHSERAIHRDDDVLSWKVYPARR